MTIFGILVYNHPGKVNMPKERSRRVRFSSAVVRLAAVFLAAAGPASVAFAALTSVPLSAQADPFYHRTFLQGEKALLDGNYAAAADAMEIARFGLRAEDSAAIKALLYLGISRFNLNDRRRSREELSAALRLLNGRRLAGLDLHPWIRSSLEKILAALGLAAGTPDPDATEDPVAIVPGREAADPEQSALPSPGTVSLADLERDNRLRPDDRPLTMALLRAYAAAERYGPARDLARSLSAADRGDSEAAFWSAKLNYLRKDFRGALSGFNGLIGPAFALGRNPDIDRRARVYAILCLHRLDQTASVKTSLTGLQDFMNAPELHRILAEENLTTAWETMKARLKLKSP